jgi:hypothetical protein
MERREEGLDALGAELPAGHMIKRNPGVSLLWTTRSYRPFRDGSGGILFRVGEPSQVEWFAEGRLATRAEVEESVRTGLPALEELTEGPVSRDLLKQAVSKLELLYPTEQDSGDASQ